MLKAKIKDNIVPYEVNITYSLREVRKIIYDYIFHYKCSIDFYSKAKVIKSVYSPASDVYSFYLNSYGVCTYIQDRIKKNVNLNLMLKDVLIDEIDDDIVCIEFVVKNEEKISLNKKYNIKIIAI